MKKIKEFLDKPVKLTRFAFLLSLFNLVFFNIPFFEFVSDNYVGGAMGRFLLLASLVIVMLALNYFASYLVIFLLRSVGKVLVAIANFISATCTYFVITYKVIMDATMLGNVFNTQYSEASGFFSAKLVLFVIALGLIPSILIICKKIDYCSWKRFGVNVSTPLGLTVLLVLVNLNNVLWIGKYDTQLGGLLMPWSYTDNTVRLINEKNASNREEIPLPDAVIANDEKTAVVLVIGESARKANYSLYGYARQTNPLLSQVPDLHVFEANACATYTTAGVRAILEYDGTPELYEILPNYMFRSGVDVVWRTYNWGEPPVHIDEYLQVKDLVEMYSVDEESAKYDGILLTGLKERIMDSDKNKVLVILHTSTSHGPAYTRKYPAGFEVFTPVCDDVENADKDLQQLVNAYDNTVVYTDYLLNEIIDMLKGLEEWNTAMMFVSDHGESLGENKLFMHGVPLKVAPAVQYEIPFLVWTSEGFRQYKSFDKPVNQHYVFHSVMDLLDVSSPVFNPDRDIFQP